MQAYCMRCKTKREMKDARSITMKNGKSATQGLCPACGTKMFRIGKGQTHIVTISVTEGAGYTFYTNVRYWAKHLLGYHLMRYWQAVTLMRCQPYEGKVAC